MDRLSHPSVAERSAVEPVAQPTRLQLLNRRKGREFSGETNDLNANFDLTTGIINYTGHLPGIKSSYGSNYPTQIKKCQHFISTRDNLWGKSHSPLGDDQHDTWGNLRVPDGLKKDVANLYLRASNPDKEYDLTRGIGASPSPHRDARSSPTRDTTLPARAPSSMGGAMNQSSVTATFFPHTVSAEDRGPPAQLAPKGVGAPLVDLGPERAGEPRHVTGYAGFQPGTRDMFGEPFNRVDCRVQAEKAQNARASKFARGYNATSRGAGTTHVVGVGAGNHSGPSALLESENPRFLSSYETHNLVMGNKGSVRH